MEMSGMALGTVLRASVVVALALAVGLAGCGGGEEGGSQAEEGVSKQEFIRNADAICAEANKRRDAIQEAAALPQKTGRELEKAVPKYAREMRPVLVGALERLKAFERPRGDEETIEAILAKFERAFAAIDKVASRAAEQGFAATFDEWTERAIEGQNIAAKYGLKECARFGTP